MNSKRKAAWLAFFGIAAALAWAPEFFQAEEPDALSGTLATTPAAVAKPRVAAAGKATPIRDLSPVADLFSSRSWKPAATLATVTEQPLSVTSPVQAPTAPEVPFQFVGRLHDSRDLQVFLQEGEKLYVVRKGDVIDENWRVEGISDVELSFVYLPLHVSRTLSVGSSQ